MKSQNSLYTALDSSSLVSSLLLEKNDNHIWHGLIKKKKKKCGMRGQKVIGLN